MLESRRGVGRLGGLVWATVQSSVPGRWVFEGEGEEKEEEGFELGKRSFWRPRAAQAGFLAQKGEKVWRGLHAGQFQRRMPGGSAVQGMSKPLRGAPGS